MDQQQKETAADTTTTSSSNATTVEKDNPPAKAAKQRRWFPLESNPSVINKYLQKLGFDTSVYEFVDVFSTESWALDMIAKPVAAVIILYPLTEKQEAHRKKEDEEVKKKVNVSDKVWHMKQRIGNACGTIGILHALANIPEGLRAVAISSGDSDTSSPCWLRDFYDRTPAQLDCDVKAEILENDAVLETLHDAAASDGEAQTSRGSINDRVLTHFAALVHVDGGLYELDGRKSGPVRHGDTTEMKLLEDACRVVKEFMERDPGEMRFTIMALAPKQEQ